jgi:NAD(P)-dependent dehydrogenase (short-subunit alcohol dehydrogenase family)
MDRMCSLEDKTALVTGSRRGIGKAIALAFAEAGADVAVCSQTGDETLEAVAKEIRNLGRRSMAIKADVSLKADVDAMVDKVIDNFGKIDILVNCAGMWIPGRYILDCDEESWDRVLNVSLKSVYLCCQAVGKRMVERKSGNIINMSSRAGIYPRRMAGSYSAAKAGVIILTKQLALELADYNIRVNAIAPGFVRTDMTSSLLTPEGEKRIAEGILIGRVGEADDIIGAALFLASDAAKFIMGETIVVDGGGDSQRISYKPN